MFLIKLRLTLEGNIFTVIGINGIATCWVPQHRADGEIVKIGELHTWNGYVSHLWLTDPLKCTLPGAWQLRPASPYNDRRGRVASGPMEDVGGSLCPRGMVLASWQPAVLLMPEAQRQPARPAFQTPDTVTHCRSEPWLTRAGNQRAVPEWAESRCSGPGHCR